MMYPLVRELAADGIPVTVTCRVLQLPRQPYYRWLADPVPARDREQAYLATAVFDPHPDDPEFGYRLLADEAREVGQQACDRTVWRICAANRWWSSFGAKKDRNGKRPGPPMHDDLLERQFRADASNQLWLTDITEHRTNEGKLYLCAVEFVFSGWIVGHSIADRMKARIAVDAIASVANPGVDGTPVAGCIVHSDRGPPSATPQIVAAGRSSAGRQDAAAT